MKKLERKLLKLQTKAQECVSRKKAAKVLKKWDKFQKPINDGVRTDFPHKGVVRS